MTTLKFADTHNLVAFFEKPTKSEGFKQIVDFLNASHIMYALTFNPIIYASCIHQFWATTKVKSINEEVQLQALVDGKKVIITEMSVRKDLQLEDVEGIECLPNDAIFEQFALIGFVQVFLDKQVEGMSKHKGIYVTPSHTKKVFTNMKRQGKDFSGRVTPLFPTMMVQDQEDMGEGSSNPINPHHTPTIIQPSTSQSKKKQLRKSEKKNTKVPQPSGSTDDVADENVTNTSSDLPQSGKDRLKLNELMDLCTNLSQRVLDLENTKTSQAVEITELKERVKKLEKKGGSRTHKLKILYKGRYGDDLVFDTGVLEGEEVFVGQSEVEKEVSAADQVTTTGEVVTTASVHVSTAIPTETTTSTTTTEPLTIPKAKSITFREPGESTTRTTPTPIPSNIKDKGKAKMIKPEKPLKMKEQIRLDEELALKLQAEEQEEDRLAREKSQQVEDANIAEWDDVQAMMDADYELAARLQAEEQGELTIKERLKLFMELMDKRKKHFARLRAEERRRKPPTKAQKRNQIYSEVVKGSNDRAEGSETRAEGSSKRAGEDL
ncbi:hypothetical protein Tco_0811391 [Tanacetum coccineum]